LSFEHVFYELYYTKKIKKLFEIARRALISIERSTSFTFSP